MEDKCGVRWEPVDQGEDQGATAEEEAPVKKKKKRVRDSSVEDLRASAE